jgi:hypothetical protein
VEGDAKAIVHKVVEEVTEFRVFLGGTMHGIEGFNQIKTGVGNN